MATKTNTLTKAQGAKLSRLPTMSSRIRYLTSLKWERGAIARKLGIIYQWVYNVQHQVVKSTKE